MFALRKGLQIFTLGPLPFIFLPDLVTSSLLWYVDWEFDRLLKIKIGIVCNIKEGKKIKTTSYPHTALSDTIVSWQQQYTATLCYQFIS